MLALAAGTMRGGPAMGQVVTSVVSGGDPVTAAGWQSETACAVSTFADRQVEVIAANDGTESGFLYTDTARAVPAGSSLMGWFFREVTNSDRNPAWQHRHIAPGSGAAAGVSVLWGDPAVGSGPTAPGLVLLGSLMVPSTKFPSTGCTDSQGNPFGCIVNSAADTCTNLGGACVARSLDGGKTFTMLHCFSDLTPGGCIGGITASTLGHFYDGMDIAVGSGTDPPAAVASRDVDTSREALWMIPAAATGTSFTQTVAGLGPIGTLGGPLERITIHVRMRMDAANALWRMSLDQRSTFINNVSTTVNDLKVNILGRNAAARVVAGDHTFASEIPITGVPTGLNDPMMQLSPTIRFGPQFDFDVGKNEAGVDEMRFVYLATSGGASYVQAGYCTTDLSTCVTPPEWRSTMNPTLKQFHPTIKYGTFVVGGTQRHFWKVSYMELNANSSAAAVFGTDLKRDGTTTTGAVPFAATAVTPFQAPCPDSRGVPGGGPGTDDGDYWGDYDDMAFNPATCSFIRPYTDSSLGCVARRAFSSSHQHVSAVEMPCPVDPQSRRRVDFSFSVDLNDDDFGDPDECATWGFQRDDCSFNPDRISAECNVDPLRPIDDNRIVFNQCTGDEVRGTITIKCVLEADPNNPAIQQTVHTFVTLDCFEGTSCNGDHVASQSRDDVVGPGASFGITGMRAGIEFDPSNGAPFDQIQVDYTASNIVQP